MNTGSYVNGKWFHPKSSRLVRNLNPADPDDVIAEFPAATAEDVQRAIDARKPRSRGWRKTPGPERGRVLWRAADIARQRADEIARTLTREEGKILKEAKGEVMKGISLLEFYAGEGFRMHGKTLPSEARDTFTYTIRQPLGVVGLIAPWNFPWAIPVWKSAPALVGRQLRHLQTRGTDAGDGDLAHGNLRKKPACLRACSTCWSAPAPSSAKRWFIRRCFGRSRSPAPMKSAARFTPRRRSAARKSLARWAAKMRSSSWPTPISTKPPSPFTAAPSDPPVSAARRLRA